MRRLRWPLTALAVLSLLGTMGGAALAEESDEAMASATVQGQVFFDGVTSSGSTTMDDDAWRVKDMGISLRVDADDDRLDGAGTARSNSSKYPFPLEVQAGIYDFANDDGRWVGTVTAFVEPTMGIDHDTVILSGAGAYEGLSAYLLIDWSSLPAEFIGAIFPGEMPPYPDQDSE
jgi:hypothetical protein